MACPENEFSTSLAGALNIIEQEDESMSERVSGPAMEFEDVPLQVAKRRNGRISSQQVDLLTDTSFERNIFEWYTKSLEDLEDITTRNTRELIDDDGLHIVFARGDNAKEDGFAHYKEGCDYSASKVSWFGTACLARPPPFPVLQKK